MRHAGRHLLAAVLLLSTSASAFAQAAPPCQAPEYRQFDFWVGEWEVRTPAGAVAGTNRIEAVLGGCALQEHWVGSKGGSGTSLNYWRASDSTWHQLWVDSGGNQLELTGSFRDGKMVLESGPAGPSGTGAGTRERITWIPLPEGRVRQLWEHTVDGGATWTVQFDGLYTRHK